MPRTFLEIWVKGSPISKFTLMEIVEKYDGVWTNGRALRTNNPDTAKKVKKELEKQFPHWVFIDIKNPETGRSTTLYPN